MKFSGQLIHRILLIEDDADLLELFADALGRSGFSVDRFTDPVKALALFEQNSDRYDLVLSDIRMPGMTGIDLVRRVKRINANVNCVLMSAFETEHLESQLNELDLSTFMKKPIHIGQLITAVKGCITNSRNNKLAEKFR
jgi:two-component system cell cycle sensor histidine kinase/response regulator CckA